MRILPRIPQILLVLLCLSLKGRAQLIQTYGLGSALKMDTPAISADSIKAILQKGNCQLSIPVQNMSDSTLDLFLYCGDLDSVNARWFKKGTIVWHALAGYLCRPEKGSTLAQRYYAAVPLHFEPRDSGWLVLDFHQKTRQFEFRGVNVFTNDALNSAQAKEYEADHAYYVFQWLFQGFLVCQLLYIFLQWLIVRRKEYLYYLGYLIVILLYFLSKYETFLGLDGPFSQWPMLKVYLGKTLLIFPYFLYLRFIRSFLEIPKHWPVLNRWLKWMEYYLLAYTTVDLILIVTTGDVRLQTELYTFTLLAFFIMTTWSSVYLFLHRQTLIYYILGGSLALAVGSILGQVLTYLIFYRHMDLDVQHILLYPQVGILVEILCFTAGLGHKNLIAEKEKLLSQQKLIDQRNKIAQDLHDDIGSTLSSISILSELAIHEGTIAAVHEIKDSAILLMERMDDIVWSINPRNDSLDNLLMRIRNFATTLFEARGLDYNIDIQKDLDQVKLPMDYRQHIYMILKEAINNLVKYSGAAQASIQVSREAHTLSLTISDNGRGFEVNKPANGNGIPGMKRRANAMGATIEVHSKIGSGTTIKLRVTRNNSDEYPIGSSREKHQF